MWVTGRFVANVGAILTHNVTAEHVETWFETLGPSVETVRGARR